MTVSKEEVARAAIALEEDGRALYLEVAEKTADDLAKKMFLALADDELDHIDWIKDLVPAVDASATANRRLHQKLRHIFADVPEAKARAFARAEDDVKAIHIALGKERESIDAYDKWAAESDDPDVAGLCNTIAGIERFHVQVLNNTLEYFEHTPDWFMQEEQWNFEGA